MEATKIRNIVELTGIIAVVASLIFVGLQIKQTYDISLSQQYFDRLVVSMDYWNSQMEHELVMEDHGNIFLDRWKQFPGVDHSLSAAEVGKLFVSFERRIALYDNLHYQYESGFLSDSSWDAYQRQLATFISRPEPRFVLLNNPWRESFSVLAESLLE